MIAALIADADGSWVAVAGIAVGALGGILGGVAAIIAAIKSGQAAKTAERVDRNVGVANGHGDVNTQLTNNYEHLVTLGEKLDAHMAANADDFKSVRTSVSDMGGKVDSIDGRLAEHVEWEQDVKWREITGRPPVEG